MNIVKINKFAILSLFLLIAFLVFPVFIMAQTIPLDERGGGIIAFNSDRDGNSEVYLMNADGSGQRNITNNPANDGFGVWSPDGMKIAFVSDRDGSFGVYVMNALNPINAEFSTPVKIANKRPSSRVSWSPDGSKILFDAWPECELYIVNANGNNLTQLTNTPDCESQPHFSPDGLKVAFSLIVNDQQDVCVMNADGSNKTRITTDGVSFFPTWSPDGSTIAIMSSRPGRQDVDICLINPDGSNRRWLTNYSNHDEFPSWSPDGLRIAYHSQRGANKIYIMNSDGSNNNPITTNTTYNNGEPNWRPVDPHSAYEGQIVYCSVPISGPAFPAIFTINSDGTDNRKVSKAQLGLNHPDWSPDAKYIAVVAYVSINPETYSIYVFDADGSNLKRLTNTVGVLDAHVSWSHDGTQLAFTRIYPGQNNRCEIWVMNSDGSNQRWTGILGYGAMWSPDDTHFVYQSGPFTEINDICVCRTDGTDIKKLTSSNDDEESPAWSPDGSQIAYSTNQDGNSEIYIMESNGSNKYRVTNNEFDNCDPRWSPDGMSIAFDSGLYPYINVYLINVDGSNLLRVTDSPQNYIAINPVWKPMPDTTSVKDDGQSFRSLPKNFQLFQNYPNPFNSSTTIRYHICQPGNVRMQIFDTLGRLVHTLIDNQQQAGDYQIGWDGTGRDGLKVSTGIYLCQLTADSYSLTNKLILIK